MKILLCTDGSHDGLEAMNLGVDIAARLNAEITLLCVVEGKRRDLEKPPRRAIRAMEELDVAFEFIGRRGKLIDEMLAQMLQDDYQLVIVGYHARTFLEKALWGSLAARVAHELPVSVLIVRGRREGIKQILIGISGGGFTNECVKWGGQIAASFGARVTLLHASPPPPLMYAGLEEVVENLTEFLQTDTTESQALKYAVAHLTELGVQTDVRLVRGLAEREILRLAQDHDVDLLVVGSSWAAQPVHRFFVRNVTEQVLLNTQRPVLVVRPKG
jgi:nucleotide-binding universal stress UspA family protein